MTTITVELSQKRLGPGNGSLSDSEVSSCYDALKSLSLCKAGWVLKGLKGQFKQLCDSVLNQG